MSGAGIPAAAIDAAAKAAYEFRFSGFKAWDDLSEHEQSEAIAEQAFALKAAAPHMLARAFDEGQKSGARHADRLVAAAKIGRPELPGPISPNPYRPTA